MPQCKAFGCFNRQGEGDAKGKSFFAFPKQNVYLKSAYGSFSLLFAAVKKKIVVMMMMMSMTMMMMMMIIIIIIKNNDSKISKVCSTEFEHLYLFLCLSLFFLFLCV